MTITTGPIGPAGRADWERLYRGYAEFYRMPMSEAILETVWGWLQDADNPFFGLVARGADARAFGFMHYREMPSPLRGCMVGFLDDLFVDPARRGEGAGEALFAALRAAGQAHGWPVIRWITRDDNYRARSLYDRVSTRTDWVTYQLDIG